MRAFVRGPPFAAWGAVHRSRLPGGFPTRDGPSPALGPELDDARVVVVERLRSRGGFARSGEIARTSAERARLAAAVRDGQVVRVARGVVALPAAAAQATALAQGGSVTCVSALARHGLPLLEAPVGLHVAVPRCRGSSGGVTKHWSGTAPPGAVVPVPLALAHAVRCLAREEWIAAADAAVARGIELVDVRACRSTRGAAKLESWLSLVDARSGSLPESLLRVALVDSGLPVEPQALVPGVGRVDFLVDGVIVEVDGFAYHSGRDQYREDRRRDRAAHRLGYVVLRYTFEEVVYDRARVVAEVAHFCGSDHLAAHAASGG